MISEKMKKLTANSSVIRAMFEEGSAMAAKHGRENVFDFSLGNPSIPAPGAVNKAIGDIVASEDSVSLHGYMSNAGYPAVRARVARSLNGRFGTSYDENNIIMSCGAAGGLNVVLKTLLDPGDEVIVIAPFFVEYLNYIDNYDGKAVIVPARQDDFMPDMKAIGQAVTGKTKAIIINSPNNPTGVVYDENTITALAAALGGAACKNGRPIYLISDEPYRELAYDGISVPFPAKYYDNTIICYSWSKSLSLPGERIGYILIPGEAYEHSLIFDAASIATRVLGFVNAPSLMQKAAACCIDEKTDIDAYDANRKLLYNALTRLGFEPVYPQGAFYLWVKAPPGGRLEDEQNFIAAAKSNNILAVPGSAFKCPGYARIAYCVSKDMIERSLPAFEKLAGQLGMRS